MYFFSNLHRIQLPSFLLNINNQHGAPLNIHLSDKFKELFIKRRPVV